MLQLLDHPLHYLQLPHLQHSPRIQRNHHPAVISAQGWPSNWLFFTRTSHPCESVLKIFKFLVKCQQPKHHLNLDMCFSRGPNTLLERNCFEHRHATSPLEPHQIGPVGPQNTSNDRVSHEIPGMPSIHGPFRPRPCQAANLQFLHLEGQAANL